MELVLVSGNENKLKEIQKILEGYDLKREKIDLDEIQSLDLEEITKHKVIEAYERIKRPVIVEDTGFFLEEFNGLPGPFIKFFNDKLGSISMIKMLGESKNRLAYAKTCIGFYDGKNLFVSSGKVEGDVTYELREGEGFGFDFCFIPKGYDKTFSELGLEVKNKISHRKRALEQFKEDLEKLNLK